MAAMAGSDPILSRSCLRLQNSSWQALCGRLHVRATGAAYSGPPPRRLHRVCSGKRGEPRSV